MWDTWCQEKWMSPTLTNQKANRIITKKGKEKILRRQGTKAARQKGQLFPDAKSQFVQAASQSTTPQGVDPVELIASFFAPTLN